MNTAANVLNALEKPADGILIYNDGRADPNFYYLTGIGEGQLDGALVWATADRVTVLVPKLEEALARRQLKGTARVEVYSAQRPFATVLQGIIGRTKRVAINEAFLPAKTAAFFKKTLPKAQFVDASAALAKCRLVKSASEISKIAQAVAISEKAFANLLDSGAIRAGATESQVAARLDYEMALLGSTPSFPTIIAFGPNAAEPHHPPSNRKLKRGDLVLADFGSKYLQYCSDITRTYAFGKPLTKMERMHQIVLEAQQRGIDLLQEGMAASAVHSACETFIDASLYKGRFIHSTGHGLGLEVHDGGTLSRQPFTLQRNMVFTVEPGIYVPGVGGVRIEDDCVVNGKRCRVLSKSSRELERI